MRCWRWLFGTKVPISQGWVPAAVLATFNKLKVATKGKLDEIVDAARSEILERIADRVSHRAHTLPRQSVRGGNFFESLSGHGF